jgi:hypothetical protein
VRAPEFQFWVFMVPVVTDCPDNWRWAGCEHLTLSTFPTTKFMALSVTGSIKNKCTQTLLAAAVSLTLPR